jgi:hypothetical protein
MADSNESNSDTTSIYKKSENLEFSEKLKNLLKKIESHVTSDGKEPIKKELIEKMNTVLNITDIKLEKNSSNGHIKKCSNLIHIDFIKFFKKTKIEFFKKTKNRLDIENGKPNQGLITAINQLSEFISKNKECLSKNTGATDWIWMPSTLGPLINELDGVLRNFLQTNQSTETCSKTPCFSE